MEKRFELILELWSVLCPIIVLRVKVKGLVRHESLIVRINPLANKTVERCHCVSNLSSSLFVTRQNNGALDEKKKLPMMLLCSKHKSSDASIIVA